MLTDDRQNAAPRHSGLDPESVEHTAVTFATDPETIFVASACEYGVAVQGDVSMATSIMVTDDRRKNYFKAFFKTSRFACIDLRYVAPPLTAFASVACIESITSMPRFLFLEFLFTVFAIF